MNLFTWKNLPVLLSATTDCATNDKFYDFALHIDENTGLVSQKIIPPQDILYKQARNSGIGKTWEDHYECFYQFICKNLDLTDKKICEIGSGNGVLAKKISKKHKIVCYEPNPTFGEDENITLRKEFFKKSEEKYDIIITSHTLEHIENVDEFLQVIYGNLNEGGHIIMAFPNFEIGLIKGHINIFNTEHISYFTPSTTKRVFNKNYYQNCVIEEYRDHSIFVLAEKSNDNTFDCPENDIKQIKKLVNCYFSTLNNKILNIVSLLENFEYHDLPLYIFGCHAMTSIFLNLSKVNPKKFLNILDNDPLKSKTRLYGTDLIAEKPENVKKGYVLLNGAAYHEEIKQGLIEKGFNVIDWV